MDSIKKLSKVKNKKRRKYIELRRVDINTNRQLTQAAGRNIDSGIDLAREMYKKTIMTGDERNFYCFIHKM